MNSNIHHHMKICGVPVLLMCAMLLCGCTQQNGHLGALFGSWALIEITRDGNPVEFEYETAFSFQNEIVNIVGYVDPPYDAKTRYGNFTHIDNNLTLKFASSPTPTDGRMYMAPEWLYFPKDENVIHFEVKKLTGSVMELILVSDGMTNCYSFRKTW